MSGLIQRRRFLLILSFTTASVGAAAVGLRIDGATLRRILRARYQAAFILPDASPGPLDDHANRTLLAVTDVLLAGTPAEAGRRDHYEDHFRWNAENRPGYRVLYDRLAEALDGAARQAGAEDFTSANAVVRRQALGRAVASRVPVTRQEELRALVFREDRWLFRVRITEEILRLFCRTDAMIALGYDYWPGEPRGLDDYTRPPSRKRWL